MVLQALGNCSMRYPSSCIHAVDHERNHSLNVRLYALKGIGLAEGLNLGAA